MGILEQIKEICDGIEHNRDVPPEAEKLAKENGVVIIVGGSDDLMYCFGAESYLTDHCEHGYGWDGDDLKEISDKNLRAEAKQLGLMIWWCGTIDDKKIEGYDIEESGAFSYSVNPEIESLDFKVIEEDGVYCTGKIIKLPEGFVSSKED